MLHVWELDSWPLLYDSMYELSEAKWYRALGDTVASESQELLVNFTSGYGIYPRRPWQNDVSAGYGYLSEEWLLSRRTTMHAFMRELNWLAAELHRYGIVRTWCARQITGCPGLICVLWQIPDDVDVHACLDAIADDAERGARYAKMLRNVADLRREVMFPMYTERLDERIRGGEHARIVRAELPNSHRAGTTAPGGLTLT
jgi:hypothetical protein